MAVSEQQRPRQRDSRPRKALTIGAVCKILAERVRRHLDLEDPLPRGPEAADAAAHAGRLPPLQPVRRRAAADDPAPAARRVPAAAGDPPGARRRRRHRLRRRRRATRPAAGAVRRAILVNTSSAYLTLDEVIEETGARARADRRAGELRHRPAREARRQDRLRRDRPRDRPRRQRALPGRRRRPQPARLPLLGRPRGEPAGSAARPLAALAQPGAAQGGAGEPREPGGDRQPPQAPAAGPGPAPPRRRLTAGAGAPRHPPPHDRRPRSDEVWELVSDPYSLPRWWPRTSRVESVDRKPGGQAQPVDQGAGDGRGARRAGRLPLPQLGRGRALRLGAAARRARPFERHLRRSMVEIGLRAEGEGTEVSLTSEQTLRGMSRLGSPMMRGGQGKILDEALDGHRAGADRMTARPRRDSKWWGWGDPAIAPELDGEALATLRERVGELEPCAAGRASSSDFELPEAEPLPPALVEAVGEDDVFDLDRGPGPPRDRLRLRRPGAAARRAARRGARRGRCCPPTPTRCAACSRSAPPRASPSSPSAAAPASSAGSSRCAAPTRAWSASTSRGCADVEVDRRSLTARLGAGLRGPEAEAALGRRGRRPRPLPAVLRVRDDRRLRRDPLGRPGLERLRPLRRAGQLGAADRARRASCARWRRRTPPPGPRCASSSSAPRASSA